MSAYSVMVAMAPVLTSGTNVQASIIEDSLDVTNQIGFPVVILNCPKSVEDRKSTGLKGELHTVHVQYVDVWDQSQRDLATITKDARTQLEQMKANMRASRTLSGGVISAGEHMETEVQGVITDKDFPVPLFAASLLVDVAGGWFAS